jgi:predicted DNA-binding transcriptional regulator AlpA
MKAIASPAHDRAAKSITQLSDVLDLSAESRSSSNVQLYRLPQVLARIPVSRSSWFAGIQAGRYPKGYCLGLRTTVWRSDEIDQLVTSLTH